MSYVGAEQSWELRQMRLALYSANMGGKQGVEFERRQLRVASQD